MLSLAAIKEKEKIAVDKGPQYLSFYEELFSSLRSMKLSILEIGIFQGESLKLWHSYFPNAKIYGLDINPPNLDLGSRVRVARADQADAAAIDSIIRNWGVDFFDIIIDDASHIGNLSAATFS